MMRDFTLAIYRELLLSAKEAGYVLTSYEDYIANGAAYEKVFILRHDVDARPHNSYRTAVIEREVGARGSYYFRVVPQSLDEEELLKIRELGHEIGYHYEDMALMQGDSEKAYEHFCRKLALFRSYYPVKTICMHGSPLSKWDNRSLWKDHDYKALGILGEPYFDLDFNKVLYITDTGRSWNKSDSSVRDKVTTQYAFRFRSTADIIAAFKKKALPAVIMLNIHPQRWTDNYYFWLQELLVQNLKNIVKKVLVKTR
jgi:hypothetical protein